MHRKDVIDDDAFLVYDLLSPEEVSPYKKLAAPKNLRYHPPSKIPIYGEAGALDRFRQSGVNGQ